MSARTPVLRAVLVLLALLALCGCGAGVATGVTVTGASTATVQITATFTGEAANVLAHDASTRQGLINVFTSRIGARPQIEVSSSQVRATLQVPYTKVADLAGITSVASIALDPGGQTIRVNIVAPTELAAAITAQTKSQPDAAVLAQTMQQSTLVQVAITYRGGLRAASSTVKGAHLRKDGNTATLTTSASSTGRGTFVVSGSPTRRHWVLWGALVGVLVLGAGATYYRRRPRQ